MMCFQQVGFASHRFARINLQRCIGLISEVSEKLLGGKNMEGLDKTKAFCHIVKEMNLTYGKQATIKALLTIADKLKTEKKDVNIDTVLSELMKE